MTETGWEWISINLTGFEEEFLCFGQSAAGGYLVEVSSLLQRLEEPRDNGSPASFELLVFSLTDLKVVMAL